MAELDVEMRRGLIDPDTTRSRTVAKVIDSLTTLEGGGFTVHRPFPTRTLDHFDPFLLLDEGGPEEYGPGEAKGAPDHPHRGFETLTYILEGTMHNWDSTGFSGHLAPGDIEWTTAGAGIIHGGLPDEAMMTNGGRMHVLQLWVNLARDKKWIPPQSTDLRSEEVPVIHSDDGSVSARLIAGEAWEKRAKISTTTPIFYLLYEMSAGAELIQRVPEEWNVFAYVLDGSGEFDANANIAGDQQMIIFDRSGDAVRIKAGASGLRFILLGGQPLNETVARYGPFVMNTRQEIMQAINDYEEGVFHRAG